MLRRHHDALALIFRGSNADAGCPAPAFPNLMINQANTAWRRRCRAALPTTSTPRMSIAQVAGSGTAPPPVGGS